MKDTDIVARLRLYAQKQRETKSSVLGLLLSDAADEIERLRAERDEARRMYCEAVILHGTAHRFDANGVPDEITDAKEFARRLRWDCYKENTNAQGQ